MIKGASWKPSALPGTPKQQLEYASKRQRLGEGHSSFANRYPFHWARKQMVEPKHMKSRKAHEKLADENKLSYGLFCSHFSHGYVQLLSSSAYSNPGEEVRKKEKAASPSHSFCNRGSKRAVTSNPKQVSSVPYLLTYSCIFLKLSNNCLLKSFSTCSFS